MTSTTTTEDETIHEKFERKVVEIFDGVHFRVPAPSQQNNTREERERLAKRARNRAREAVYVEPVPGPAADVQR
eukprot:2865985-Rhodomonas_salina.2